MLSFLMGMLPHSINGQLVRYDIPPGARLRFTCPEVGTKCAYDPRDFDTVLNPSRLGPHPVEQGIFVGTLPSDDNETALVLGGCDGGYFEDPCYVFCSSSCTCTKDISWLGPACPKPVQNPSFSSLKPITQTCDVYDARLRWRPGRGSTLLESAQGPCTAVSPTKCFARPDRTCRDDTQVLCCVLKTNTNGYGDSPGPACIHYCTNNSFATTNEATTDTIVDDSQDGATDDPLELDGNTSATGGTDAGTSAGVMVPNWVSSTLVFYAFYLMF